MNENFRLVKYDEHPNQKISWVYMSFFCLTIGDRNDLHVDKWHVSGIFLYAWPFCVVCLSSTSFFPKKPPG